MAKKWSAAGNTFCTIANHHTKVKTTIHSHLSSHDSPQFGNKHDAATNFVDAANCYKKNDPKEAAASLQKVTAYQLMMTDMMTDILHRQVDDY